MSAIELKNITKRFKDGSKEIEVVKDTSFTINEGEFVAIIGPSGSGKSTLLTMMGGLQSPTSGEVLIKGERFSDKPEKQRADVRFKEIGFILQASNLVPFLTVKKQFQLVDKINKAKQEERRTYLLERLGIQKLADKYPSDLSGGERQRVAIARALYHQPAVILADEPTASLDTEHAFEVVKILSEEAKEEQKATIMVTHDPRLLEHCDRIFKMEDGILIEQKKV